MTWFLAIGGLLVLLAAGSQALSFKIAADHPPRGVSVPVDGGRLHVVAPARPATGDAPSLLLIHGASANSADMLLALSDRLGAAHHVVAVDRPGHGWSDRPGGRSDSDPGRQAALIRSAAERAGVKRAIVVGHSLAGVVATRLVLDHPDLVAGLVLLSPVTHPWPGGVAWYYDVAATPGVGWLFTRTLAPLAGWFLMDSGVKGSFAPETPPPDYTWRSATALLLRPSHFQANAEDVADLHGHVERQWRDYGRIQVPTTVIHGDGDTVTSPVIHSQAFVRQVPGARLVMVPGGGHMPHHVHTDVVVREIEEVVRRAAAASPPR